MKILLAVDDSKYSQIATKAVAERCWPAGTVVRVLSVVENIIVPATEPWVAEAAIVTERAEQAEQQLAKQLTAKIASSLRTAGLQAEAEVRTGNASAVIVAVAEAWQADLIVVGSHGYTGIKKLLLGSVAQSVVSHAPCSVEVVREKAAKVMKRAAR